MAASDRGHSGRVSTGVVDLTVGDGVDVERRLSDRAGRCVGVHGVVATAVAVVDRVGDHRESAAVGAHDVLREERLAPSGHRVAALQLTAAQSRNPG